MKIDKSKLAKSIALPLLVGVVSGFVTNDSMKVFEALKQPPLSPPGWVFPVVWTILYTLMGVSAYIIQQAKDEIHSSEALLIYYYQLIVNFLWPMFFFYYQWFLFAFFWLLLLWIMVIRMIMKFTNISKIAAYLNIPYILWLTFAAYLNIGVWWLNK